MWKNTSLNLLRARLPSTSSNFDVRAMHRFFPAKENTSPTFTRTIVCSTSLKSTVMNCESKLNSKQIHFMSSQFLSTCSNQYSRDSEINIFQFDMNVPKDTLLYSYSRDRFYTLFSYFGIAQCFFWLYLTVFSYTTLRDTKDSPWDENISGKKPWWRRINFGENKYKNGIALVCFSVGYVILSISILYPLRAINQIWLLKGGEAVKMRTYGPFGKMKTFVAPLDNLSAYQSRTDQTSQIALKVKGKSFFFLIDNSGTFYDTKLFDSSVGLSRKLK